MIYIVDFGSQMAHLIGRRLRQLGVETQYYDPELVMSAIAKSKPSGIIFSGGPASVYAQGAPTIDPTIFDLHIPIFGICYGWQLMAQLLGGKVESATKEYGVEQLTITDQQALGSAKNTLDVIMSHGDSVTKLPTGFTTIASTKSVKYAAVIDSKKKIYGVQFHPEADHTEGGLAILQHFVEHECGEKISTFVLEPETIIADIKKRVGKSKVICAVSGGVDSTVAAFLIGKAIGEQLIPVYIESGLMREGTRETVKHIFSKLITADLEIIDAQEKFMTALKNKTDPEEKRKTIGKLYVQLFAEVAKKHSDATFLGQGTIYSDVIESKGTKSASKIKSHHNVGGLPENMKLQLIEPVRNFYKDEVRELGRITGLPEDIIMQQPFPGPGFAVRIRGEVTPERLEKAKQSDAILIEEMKKAGLWGKVFQCFTIMTGAYSTAVKGDERAFAEVIAIRAYESNDIITSRWARIPHEVLGVISARIVNEVPDISRVVYDITSKPPATMEWE